MIVGHLKEKEVAEKKITVKALKREQTSADVSQVPEEDPYADSGTCDYVCSDGFWCLVSDDSKPGYFCLISWPGSCEESSEMTEEAISEY